MDGSSSHDGERENLRNLWGDSLQGGPGKWSGYQGRYNVDTPALKVGIYTRRCSNLRKSTRGVGWKVGPQWGEVYLYRGGFFVVELKDCILI